MNARPRLHILPVLLALGFCCLLAALPADVPAAFAASSSGKETATKSKKKDPPINIESAKMDYLDKEQKLVYTGNVVAVQGDVTLKTPQLVVFLTPKEADAPKGPPASASQVLRWEASGPVTLLSKDQIATGDSGTYEKGENKFYLNGNVVLTQNDYITKGDHCVYDLDTGRAVVTGNVRSMFPPKNNNDQASNTTDEKSTRSSARSRSKPKSP